MWYANAPIAAAKAPIIAVTRFQVRLGSSVTLTPSALQPGEALLTQIGLDKCHLPTQGVEQPEMEGQRGQGDHHWTTGAD